MKQYRCYFRTVLLSIVAAVIIDAMINFDQYRKGWVSGFKAKQQREYVNSDRGRLPVQIGKISAIAFQILSR